MEHGLADRSRLAFPDYALDDRYRRASGRVFLTGSQALAAIMIAQRRSDRAAGLNTAGFVSGYRGSPLGGVDQALWRAKAHLDAHDITFLPAINEDLAATAVLGTQQVEIEPDRAVDGVFALWYGKGPGVDRAGDALRHGNAYGSSPHGGVLVVAGDDHGCASSSMSHQSDVAFMAWYMPTIHPAHVDEYIEYGLWGFAASRYSGLWIGFKAISEIVESAASVELPPAPQFAPPADFIPPSGGLGFRWPDLPGMQIERRIEAKKEAILAFARANPIDRAIFNVAGARYGIVTTGKAHRDVIEALADLGIDRSRAAEIGIDVYKVGMVWPLECEGAQRFMAGKEEVLVVEEKRGIIESQLKEHLYDRPVAKPKRILGKFDENGAPLISWVDELSPSALAPVIAWRLLRHFPDLSFATELADLDVAKRAVGAPAGAKRLPYFCPGCPHNTSTKTPEGSKALAGIGCHFMASWMDRETTSLIQMGGEGVNWAAKSLYLKDRPHIFQNLGDGTYFHSGSMAIRQAIAAKANITYKILFNDAVAMTGGQPVDGALTVAVLARQIAAEGVDKIVVVSDRPEKAAVGLPAGVEVFDRGELDRVQRDLREIKGVTALIYEQECAAEKRRKRKRREYAEPARRVFINERVCEGCGDCSVQSNCLSVVPVDTEFGRKRRIDQSSCNKDYSCLKGFCPSFVSIVGGELRKPEPRAVDRDLQALLSALPAPDAPVLGRSYDLLVAGVGGTGVVTIGAVVAMAAHLEGKGASVLDFMGFAQKGGAVFSYVRLAPSPAMLNQVRIDRGRADAAILCDLVVGTDARALSLFRKGRTRIAANADILPTADFIRDRNVDFGAHVRLKTLKDACGEDRVEAINAATLAERFLGDLVYSNMFLLGFAWQQGLVPLTESALARAIELNGVAVASNLRAFALGRAAATDRRSVFGAAGLAGGNARPQTLAELIERRAAFLTEYQDARYADSYRAFVELARTSAAHVARGEEFATAVATNLFKLMAYKDEYEVARLYADGWFRGRIAGEFAGDYKLRFHMAPPVFNAEVDADGRPKKREFGPWMMSALSVLRRFKSLRGTALDPFGASADRKLERRLIADYRVRLSALLGRLAEENIAIAIAIASLPDDIRGYGPVKAQSVEAAEKEFNLLMARFDSPDKVVEAA
jgi:indolepyruvate ferredoxin oxidoreductase